MITGLRSYKGIVEEIENHDRKLILIPTSDIAHDVAGLNYFDIYGYYPVFSIMTRLLKDFLNTNDFGLIYPDQPPSRDNVPISYYAAMIANFGADNYSDDDSITRRLLEIYFVYHQTNNFRNIMNRLQPDPDKYKQILINYSIPDTKAATTDHIWTVIAASTLIMPSTMDLHEILNIELPNIQQPITPLNEIEDILDECLDIYRDIYNSTKVFYTSDANLKSMSYYDRFALY
jgi:hypothetical protein